jgi:hypothetical protein
LLVLDGLERVQVMDDSSGGVFGQIEDPLLKGLLIRSAEGMARTTVLVTSRFPLTDLAPYQGRGYVHLGIGGLEREAAQALLRFRGTQGDEVTLNQLIETYGAHALTLDHLGGLIGQFLGGDPSRAPEVQALAAPGGDRQALRLARLLRAYEEHLPAPELALLSRLCLLRRSMTKDQILQLFLCSPAVHARTIREIAEQIVHLPQAKEHSAGELSGLAEAVRGFLEEALCGGQLAGPEESFRREVCLALGTLYERRSQTLDQDVADLARLYRDERLDVPTDVRPLSAEDRDRLRALCLRWVELHDHPLNRDRPYDPNPALHRALVELGWQKRSKRTPEDIDPTDIVRGFRRAERELYHMAYKHLALQKVREVCRLARRKWSLAGALAPLDGGAVGQVLESLAARHLVLREADGSFSVHPAVRDHFARLAPAAEQAGWHDFIRQHLISLVRRPGRRFPEDPATLDLVEEAIHHALQAGQPDQAQWLYENALGGLRHLAWKLGEMARGLRILRGFQPCPDPWSLGWYLRALGELEQAFAHNALAFFRADIRLLQGRLPEVAAVGDSTRTPVAAFLMGQTSRLPPDQLGSSVPREQFLLYLGRLEGVRRSIQLEAFYQHIGWEGDRARSQLLLAEAARRQANRTLAAKFLDAATPWILHSGSVEHLCLLHLTRSRLRLGEGEGEAAQRAVEEGLHLARRCGLGLYHVELLCAQAEIYLAGGDAPNAAAAAEEAQRRASAPECQFAWGGALAGHLLGQALFGLRQVREAHALLKQTLEVRCRIGDPQAGDTERLLRTLGK